MCFKTVQTLIWWIKVVYNNNKLNYAENIKDDPDMMHDEEAAGNWTREISAPIKSA